MYRLMGVAVLALGWFAILKTVVWARRPNTELMGGSKGGGFQAFPPPYRPRS